MWLFVLFDLPTQTKVDRKVYAKFRKQLQCDGFTMMQYSIYTRHCPSHENAMVHIKRVRAFAPNKGNVSILKITDKQYGDIINLWGSINTELPASPSQLELF